jgi:outer membrane protein TolC
MARVRFEAGTSRRAEVEVANARAKLIRSQSARTIAYQALLTALSLPSDTAMTLKGTLEDGEALPDQASLLQTIDARPDLRAFGARRQTAEYSVALAKAEWKPTFALTGNLQYQEDAFNELLNAGNRSYAVGLALRIPLFATPAAMARKATALAQVRQTDHGLKAAVDNSRLEVTSAYTAWLGAQEIVTTQRKAVELAREGLSIAQVSYENGVITSTELNDARQSLLETEWELVQAQYAQIVAAARARLAAGQ